MPRTIVSLGKSTQDVFVRSARDFVPRPGSAGRVLTLPLGAKLDLDDLTVTTGGNAANAATTFARQGLRSMFLWALGSDPVSTRMLEDLRADRIDVSHVLVEPGRVPSISLVLLAASGERTILNHRGTTPSQGARRIDLAPIAAADWLYVSSLAGDLVLLAAAIDAAKSAGAQVLLNPAGGELERLRTLLPLIHRCDVLAVNAEEGRLILGSLEQDAVELARGLARLGPATLVTDGPRGAAYADGTHIVTAGIRHAVQVVDSTGCGDALASGFLSRLAQGEPLRRCMSFATANAASVLGELGARTGILAVRDVPDDISIEEWADGARRRGRRRGPTRHDALRIRPAGDDAATALG